MAELIESFSLEGISGGNAVFNTEKLDWMNGQYIARLSSEELLREVEPLLVGAGLLGPGARPADAWLLSPPRSAASAGEAAHRFRGARAPVPRGYG